MSSRISIGIVCSLCECSTSSVSALYNARSAVVFFSRTVSGAKNDGGGVVGHDSCATRLPQPQQYRSCWLLTNPHPHAGASRLLQPPQKRRQGLLIRVQLQR